LILPLKIPDIVIILLALVLTGFSAFAANSSPQITAQVLIQGRDRLWVFPLDAEETVAVQGPLGNTVIRIQGKQAWVESSPCENQTCVASGHIRQRRAWTACLPNNVFLMIEGNDEQANIPDSIAW
jgi:hypothetical protein